MQLTDERLVPVHGKRLRGASARGTGEDARDHVFRRIQTDQEKSGIDWAEIALHGNGCVDQLPQVDIASAFGQTWFPHKLPFATSELQDSGNW